MEIDRLSRLSFANVRAQAFAFESSVFKPFVRIAVWERICSQPGKLRLGLSFPWCSDDRHPHCWSSRVLTLSVSDAARRLGANPRDISDLFYKRQLRDDLCPIVAGRRLIPESY